MKDAMRAVLARSVVAFIALAATLALLVWRGVHEGLWVLLMVAAAVAVLTLSMPLRIRSSLLPYLYRGAQWRAGVTDGAVRIQSPLADGVIAAGGIRTFHRSGSIIVWKGPIARTWQVMPGALFTDDEFAALAHRSP